MGEWGDFFAAQVGVAWRVGPAAGIPRALLALFSSVPFIVAGVLMFVHVGGALYWIVPGVAVALIATVVNAWVLLIEILR